MSKDKSKDNLLTSKLDFEGMDDLLPNSTDFLSELDFDASQAQSQARKSQAQEMLSPIAKPLAPVPTRKKPEIPKKNVELPRMSVRRSTSTKASAKNNRLDRFTLFAVIIVVIGLIAISSGIYIARTADRNSAGLSYVVLPQSIVSVDGVVARAQATIQVSVDDQEWLQENKRALGDSFNRALATLDLDNLRNPNGIAEAQVELKELLNRDFKTNKVEAVLITELLIQDQ